MLSSNHVSVSIPIYHYILTLYLCAHFQIHFLMVISANVTHLRDARFATMNAYEDAEEANHSTKQMNDTTM